MVGYACTLQHHFLLWAQQIQEVPWIKLVELVLVMCMVSRMCVRHFIGPCINKPYVSMWQGIACDYSYILSCIQDERYRGKLPASADVATWVRHRFARHYMYMKAGLSLSLSFSLSLFVSLCSLLAIVLLWILLKKAQFKHPQFQIFGLKSKGWYT